MTIQSKLSQALLVCFVITLNLANHSESLAQEKVRTWASSDGKSTVEAELIEDQGKTILLKRKSNGKVIKVPFAKLSVADQEYLASWSSNDNDPVAGSLSKSKKMEATLRTNRSTAMPSNLKAIKQAMLAKSIVQTAGQFSLTTENDFTPALNDAMAFADRYWQLQIRISGLESDKERIQAFSGGPKIPRPPSIPIPPGIPPPAGFPSSMPDLFPERDPATVAAKIREIDSAIATLSLARKERLEKFLAALTNAGKQADEITKAYAKIRQDVEVQGFVRAYNSAAGKSYFLGPSKKFQKELSSLARLESAVVTETFPLRKEGETLYATVKLNGKNVEMIVDPIATYCLIPSKANDRVAHFSTPFDAETTVTKADGSSVKGRLSRFASIRLGSFSVSTCVSLSPEYKNEPARLGLNFLGKFNFELLEDESELKLTTIRYLQNSEK